MYCQRYGGAREASWLQCVQRNQENYISMKLSASDLENMVIKRKRISYGMYFAGLVLLALVPLAYYLGLERAGDMLEKGRAAESLAADNVLLKRELADLRLAQKVDDGTGEQLRQTIKDLRDQTGEINEELSFYRGLMAPAENQKGLRIEKLSLEENLDADRVEYRLMLTQIADRRDWVQGKVNIDVIGQVRGEEQVLSLTEFGLDGAYPLSFRFRYFQDFTGVMIMPAAFTPEEILVTAESSGKKGIRLQRRFGWNDLIR